MTTRLRITPVPAFFYVLVLLFVISPQTAFPADSANLSTVTIIPFGRIPYVSMVELAEVFRLRLDYDPLSNSMSVMRGANTLTLHNLSVCAQHNDSIENLMAPAKLFQGAIYAPAATYLPLFSKLLPGMLEWDEKEWTISASGIAGSIRSISFEERVHGTLIRIGLTEPLNCSDALSEINGGKWLSLRVQDGLFIPDSLMVEPPAGMVETVRAHARNGEMTVSFLVSDNMESYDINRNPDKSEMLISLRPKRVVQDGLSTEIFSENDITKTPVISLNNESIWVIDTVVVDPGHGGKDPGAIGPKGTKEKDIVLSIGKELKKIADARGEIKIVLTRNRDRFLSLRERANIAREANGKLFISIHANSSRSKRVSGMEVYFLSEAKEESAKRVAERENASAEFEDNPEYYTPLAALISNDMPKELREIQGDMFYNVFLTESQSMCSILLDSAVSLTRQKNRGVKQAGFYVMLGTQASMPSVLFEAGFISNAREEKLLRRASHRKRIAQAIYDSIISFKKLAEKDLFTMTGSR